MRETAPAATDARSGHIGRALDCILGKYLVS
jgi:hypothetical protein